MEDIEFDSLSMPRIKIFGVGGGGCNAAEGIRKAISEFNSDGSRLPEDAFIVANTDVQNLKKCESKIKIQLGENGRGAGADPLLGKKAAEYSADKIKEVLEDTNLVIIVSAFGGGTGTGAAPEVAKIAKSCPNNPIVVGIITQPFMFEGQNKIKIAKIGIKEFSQNADLTIIISNQLLFRVTHETLGIKDAFGIVDNACAMFVNGIIQVLDMNGLINLDFADLTTTLSDKGFGSLGIGIGIGESAASAAATQALSNPLLENTSIYDASNILVHIVGNEKMTLSDLELIMTTITDNLGENRSNVNIIYGASVVDDKFCRSEHQFYHNKNDMIFTENEKWIRVLIIATGLQYNADGNKNTTINNIITNPSMETKEEKFVVSHNKNSASIFDLFAKRWGKK